MFSKKTQVHIHSHAPQKVYEERNITVNRAPTDESVSLLKEMEEKARDKYLDGVKVDNNVLSGVVFEQRQDVYMRNCVYYSVFELNGKRYKIEGEYDPQESIDSVLMKSIAEQITAKILAEMLTHKN